MEDSMDVKSDEIMLKANDGLQLMVSKSAVKKPEAVIVIVHGICEHSGRYTHVVSRFNSWGYSVYRYDLRGHGRSQGDRAYVEDYQLFIDDTDLVVDMAKKENAGIPLFLVGHSMGGLISAIYGIQHPDNLTGQVLSGPPVMILPAVQGILSLDYKAKARTPIPNSLTNAISRNKDVIDAYNSDPLVLKEFSMMLMGEMFIRAGQWIVANRKKYNYPCLILHGGADQISPPEASRAFYENIASKDKELKIYEGLYHEILNEPEKETVLEDIHRWLEAHL